MGDGDGEALSCEMVMTLPRGSGSDSAAPLRWLFCAEVLGTTRGNCEMSSMVPRGSAAVPDRELRWLFGREALEGPPRPS